jgi:hypothetical protein
MKNVTSTKRHRIELWLTKRGYDGYFNPDGGCGCRLGDLCPCGGIYEQCRPGYLGPCDCGDHDWHICEDAPPQFDEADHGNPEVQE